MLILYTCKSFQPSSLHLIIGTSGKREVFKIHLTQISFLTWLGSLHSGRPQQLQSY